MQVSLAFFHITKICKFHTKPCLFSDEVSPPLLKLSKIILVDHHIPHHSAACINVDNVEEIIDHRPITSPLPPNAKCTIADVGSCATLIAELVLQSEVRNECNDILELLYGPIVLDTVNFSEEADKTRPLDIAVNEQIESILGFNKRHRNQLFNDLVEARNDVSTLDSLQILSKDLKIITNKARSLTVALPGYPILVQVSLTHFINF